MLANLRLRSFWFLSADAAFVTNGKISAGYRLQVALFILHMDCHLLLPVMVTVIIIVTNIAILIQHQLYLCSHPACNSTRFSYVLSLR